MTTPLRVGVIGCGGIAQMHHLPTLAERPDLFRIAALADVSRPTLDAVGRRYGVEVLATDYRELLGRPDLDALLLLTSGCHREAALELLRTDKHLFIEKPLAFSREEAEEVARAARGRRAALMVGYHKRFDPAYRRARQALQGLRDLRYAEVTVLHPDDDAYRAHHALVPPPEGTPREWPEDERNWVTIEKVTTGAFRGCVDRVVGAQAPLDVRIGVCLLFESVIHDVNALRGLLGEPEKVVSAHVWRGGFAQSSLTRFPGDLVVSLSWISLPGLRHYEERLRFVGPRERVTLTFPSPYLRHAPSPLEIERMDGEELVVEQRTVSYEEAFRAELHEFRRCVASGEPPSPSVDDAVADARWMEAIAAAYVRG
ncbi:MAG TPA: Gfo/Idh/MocA family oxidoreductase [Vicinamibacteria bacterium]|nr:Gfo/Idh/MocA family oxidoreductase [Vicinamibacteria bacterium]